MSAIFTRFSQAITYNALLYFLTKSSSIFLSIFLFHRLSTSDYSLWANTLSITFLTLLWIDLGLRKTLPRYIPLVTHSRHRLYSFSQAILIFQLSLLIVTAPFFYYFIHGSSHIPTILPLAIFFTEGLLAIIRLFFHSLFLNKPFSLLSSTVLIFETILLALSAIFISPHSLLTYIFLTKLLSSTILVIAGTTILYRYFLQYPHDSTPQENPTDHTAPYGTRSGLVKHSLLMWTSTIIKSLTERNFLMPLLTYSLGAELANIFKVAQDGALLFERTAIKTIGTADTSLLAYVHAKEGKESTGLAFQKLMHNITALCIPLFGILVFIYMKGVTVLEFFNIKLKGQYGFQIFLIFTATYLLEVLVSPYERVLEVKQRYWLLYTGYAPYIILIPFILHAAPVMGLVTFVLCMQGVRLVSACCLAWLAWREYRLPFPWQMVMGRLGIVGSVVGGLYGVVEYGEYIIQMFIP